MQHEYRKTATIKAEQFDGNEDEFGKKYQLYRSPLMSGDYDLKLITKEGPMNLNKGDWIATGVEGEHWVIADDIFCKTYERVDQ